MAHFHFELVPFSVRHSDNELDLIDLKIEGRLEFLKHDLFIHYSISGNDFSNIIWPPINQSPQLMDGLWQHTCFELFLSPANKSSYTELNFSPSQDWAVYQFSDYRRATEVVMEHAIIIETQMGNNKSSVDARSLIDNDMTKAPIDIGITAVIETKDNQLHYYALTHKATEPDFHRRDSFILKRE